MAFSGWSCCLGTWICMSFGLLVVEVSGTQRPQDARLFRTGFVSLNWPVIHTPRRSELRLHPLPRFCLTASRNRVGCTRASTGRCIAIHLDNYRSPRKLQLQVFLYFISTYFTEQTTGSERMRTRDRHVERPWCGPLDHRGLCEDWREEIAKIFKISPRDLITLVPLLPNSPEKLTNPN